MNIYDTELKEINEAIDAAENALKHLKAAKKMLSSASNWGLVDIFGGGTMTTFLKRSKMNDARKELAAAQKAVKVFDKELQDINGMSGLHIEMSDFMGVADYLFDNMLVDMMAQNRINDALAQTEQAIRDVESAERRLEQRQEDLVHEAMERGRL